MNNTHRWIAVCIVAINLFFSSCGSAKTTPTPGPTPTPFAMRKAGWEDVTMLILCLDVQQSYPNVDGKTPEPIFGTIQTMLAGIGVQVVAVGAPCDATINVTLIGEVTPVHYYGDFACTDWSQVVMKGEMLLSISDREPLAVPIYQSLPAAQRISSCMYDEPTKAPFYYIWPKPIVTFLGILWGPTFLVNVLEESPYYVNHQIGAAAKQMLIDMGPEAKEVVPRLILALDCDPVELGCIGWDAKGVLNAITGQDFGSDSVRWQTWWEQQE
jgi:hypothetical protein